MTRQSYGPGHPFVTFVDDLTAEARAERRKAWKALPKAPRAKRQIQRIVKQQREVRHIKAKAKIGYMEKLDAAIARAKAGAK